MTPTAGDFGLVTMHGWPGKLIRVGQWLDGDGYGDYEHAFLHVGDAQIVEAMPGGARLAPWDKYGDAARWSTGLIAPKDPDRVAEIGRSFVGVPYSAADYFAIATHRLHLFPADVLLKRFVASTTHLICSQLVDAAWRIAGDELFTDHRWPGYVTPGALLRLLDAAEKRVGA